MSIGSAQTRTALLYGQAIEADLAQLRRRGMADLVARWSAQYWLRRADEWERARPRLGEFTGRATPRQLSERWQHCDAIAKACRARAAVVAPDEFADVLDLVIEEAAR